MVEVTKAGRFDMSLMPDMALNKIMVGQGVGNQPVEQSMPFSVVDSMTYLMGYIHQVNMGNIPSNEILSNYTHLMYSAANPELDGSLTISGGGSNLTTFVTAAHLAGAEAILSIYDGNAALDDIVDDPTGLLVTFMASLASAVSTYDLDGFIIDWENSGKTTARMTTLLAAMRTQFPTLTLMDIQSWYVRVTSVATANTYLDFICPMTYDIYLPDGLPYHSLLDDCKAAMKCYENIGYTASKLIMGVPFYAKDNNGSLCTWDVIQTDFDPADGIDYVNATQVSDGFDSDPQTVDGGVAWFGGLTTLRKKVDFIRYESYGGIFVFDITHDGNHLLPTLVEEATRDLPPDPDLKIFHANNSIQNGDSILTNKWQGQTFTPTKSFQIKKVVLALDQTAGTGNVTVGIRATSAGLPTGSNLVEATVLSADLPQATYGRVEFEFDNELVLTKGTMYAVVISVSVNTVYLKYLLSVGDFPDGNMCHSSDGSSWTADANNDIWFEIWGL